jgi:hypothetical protein
MKKITVDKSEGIAEVIDRILAVDDSDITLVIPKGSALGKSSSNFRLLKREADSADKKVVVDSSDEAVVAFAEEQGLVKFAGYAAPEKSHHGAGMSDIVPKSASSAKEEHHKIKQSEAVKLTVRDESENEDEDAKEDGGDKDDSFFGNNRFFQKHPAVERGSHDDDDDEKSSRGMSGKAIGWTVAIIVVLAVAFYVVTAVFGHAQVTIDFTQTPWSYQANLTADSAASAINPTTDVIPAQVFTSQKNVTQLFPATGPSVGGGTKAQGTLTIYNDYSSASQELIANTRFVTPGGQVFRLVNGVTVPGAQVAGGVTTPSSITAPIIADQVGPAYNVGPVTKLTVAAWGPGQPEANAAKYAGFYGAITGQTTGGATGSHPTPTAGDIASAKASTTAILQSDLQDGLTSTYPNNFEILDGATDIQITSMIVNTSTDANGNFSVFGEASLTAIGFDQAALTNYLLGLAQATEASSSFKTINLSYSDVTANFAKGQVSFALSAQGSLEPTFSTSGFAASIAGESITAARSSIEALPELADGKISVWPMWLWSIPSNPSKIEVAAN